MVSMKLKKTVFINIILLIGSIILFFILFELFFRLSLIDFYWDKTETYNTNFSSRIQNNNSKIIILGDSQTAGYPNTSYPTMLDSLLKKNGFDVDVYNLAVKATGPKTYYYRLKTYNDVIKPEIIVIGFSVDNDLSETYRPIPRQPSILRRFYYLSSNYFSTVTYLNSISGQIKFFRSVKYFFLSNAEKNTKTNQTFNDNVVCEIGGVDAVIFTKFNETNNTSCETLGRHFRFAKDFPTMYQDSILLDNDFSKKQLRLAESYILKIKELGKKYNSTIILLIIPSSTQVDEKYYDSFYDYVGFETDKELLLNSSNIQDELKHFAKENDILFLDLLPHFKDYDDYIYYFNDVHLNEKGEKLVAELLADKIGPLINN